MSVLAVVFFSSEKTCRQNTEKLLNRQLFDAFFYYVRLSDCSPEIDLQSVCCQTQTLLIVGIFLMSFLDLLHGYG